jgi:hypothetical protein
MHTRQAADILAARGITWLPCKNWATQTIKYYKLYYPDSERIIARKPRGEGAQRDAVGVEAIARFYYALEKVLATKPRAVYLVLLSCFVLLCLAYRSLITLCIAAFAFR